MDKEIREIKKVVKQAVTLLDKLETLDKQRDPYCEAGEKMAKKEKKK